MEKVETNFPGSEEEFILVNGMMCHSCLTRIKDFSNHKAKYTPEFVQAILDSADTANLIPNNEQRQARSVALRAVLVTAASVCCKNSATLGSYIESAFPDKAGNMKKMAGGAYLAEARRGNWAAVATMNGMMLSFMGTYNADLIKGDMPVDFPKDCKDDSDAFSEASGTYENNKGIAEQQAQDRTTALNNVYTRLKGIMKDGKLIYAKDAAARKQFTYGAVMAKVTTNKRSGFRIEVTDGVTEMPVTTASVQFIQGEWLFNANKKGIIYAKVPEGNYTGTIAAPGYLPVQVKFTSNKGVVHREEIVLTAVAQKVMAD